MSDRSSLLRATVRRVRSRARRTARALARRLPSSVVPAVRAAVEGPDREPLPSAPAVGGKRVLVSEIRRIRVLPDHGADGHRLELSGWAYRRSAAGNPDEIELVAVGPVGTPEVVLDTVQRPDEETNLADVDRERDRSGASFAAVLDPAALLAAGPARNHRWRIDVRIHDRVGVRQERFGAVSRFGSAATAPALAIGARTLAVPLIDDTEGFVLLLQQPDARAGAVVVDDRRLRVRIRRSGRFFPTRAVLARRPGSRLAEPTDSGLLLPLIFDPIRHEVRVEAEQLRALAEQADGRWSIELVDPLGRRRGVRWSQPPDAADLAPALADADATGRGSEPAPWCVLSSPTGLLRLDWGRETARVVEAEAFSDGYPRLRLLVAGLSLDPRPAAAGEPAQPLGQTGGDRRADRFRLDGERQQISAESVRLTDRGVVVEFGLRAQVRFTDELRPLISGRYRLLVDPDPAPDHESDHDSDEGSDDGSEDPGEAFITAAVDRGLAARMGERTDLAELGVRIERSAHGEFAIRISAPRTAGEGGRYRMNGLADHYRSAPEVLGQPLEEAVFFDCFDGRLTGDSPRAIRAELMARRPDLTEHWVVSDLSVPLPEGARPLIWYSREYFAARARCRFVVTNCWLTADFRRRPGQRVLQTWHGTPLKRLGFDRIGADQSAKYRAEMVEQTDQWTWLLSQNPYSTEIFSRAYAYRGRLAEIGYPRNDVLSTGLDDHAIGCIRSRLGLRPGERAVLFAPTWRESGEHATRTLDFSLLSRRLGPSWRIVVRGHANTVRSGSDVRQAGVIDATSYPELTDLFAVSEMLITDYSSMMFDFAITGKPMIYFVPDLADYAETSRGTYFALEGSAPGPLVGTTEAVADEIERAADGIPAEFVRAYADWRLRFVPFDDGQASRRAVDLLLSDLD